MSFNGNSSRTRGSLLLRETDVQRYQKMFGEVPGELLLASTYERDVATCEKLCDEGRDRPYAKFYAQPPAENEGKGIKCSQNSSDDEGESEKIVTSVIGTSGNGRERRLGTTDGLTGSMRRCSISPEDSGGFTTDSEPALCAPGLVALRRNRHRKVFGSQLSEEQIGLGIADVNPLARERGKPQILEWLQSTGELDEATQLELVFNVIVHNTTGSDGVIHRVNPMLTVAHPLVVFSLANCCSTWERCISEDICGISVRWNIEDIALRTAWAILEILVDELIDEKLKGNRGTGRSKGINPPISVLSQVDGSKSTDGRGKKRVSADDESSDDNYESKSAMELLENSRYSSRHGHGHTPGNSPSSACSKDASERRPGRQTKMRFTRTLEIRRQRDGPDVQFRYNRGGSLGWIDVYFDQEAQNWRSFDGTWSSVDADCFERVIYTNYGVERRPAELQGRDSPRPSKDSRKVSMARERAYNRRKVPSMFDDEALCSDDDDSVREVDGPSGDEEEDSIKHFIVSSQESGTSGERGETPRTELARNDSTAESDESELESQLSD